METSIICECGSNLFWFFGKTARCFKCYMEYRAIKFTPNGNFELMTRRFNNIEKMWANWEKDNLFKYEIK